MNRCVKCEAGRAGTCPWIASFPAPEADPVSSPLKADETHEDRALRLHDEAGAPCIDQITIDEFLDGIDTFLSGAAIPQNQDELHSTITRLELSLSRLRRLPKHLRPVFTDITTAAVEHAYACLDYAYLKRGIDIEPFIRELHPTYNSQQMLERCNIPQRLVSRYKSKAQPYQEADIPAAPAQEDPIAQTGLPADLATPKAMSIWRRAQAAGIVGEHFQFQGKNKTELAIFAASFSTELFGEIRWTPFQQWNPYKYYSKAYGESANRKHESDSASLQAILKLFHINQR